MKESLGNQLHARGNYVLSFFAMGNTYLSTNVTLGHRRDARRRSIAFPDSDDPFSCMTSRRWSFSGVPSTTMVSRAALGVLIYGRADVAPAHVVDLLIESWDLHSLCPPSPGGFPRPA